MPPTVRQRALSTLAKKLHPQLPLTPRESQQLLNLLTTSFRSHLDREHPVHAAEKPQQSAARHTTQTQHHQVLSAPSSAALASQHLDAVLSNPLFVVKPSRRSSESAASHILRDPIGWFLNEIAGGNATLSKVSLCLDMLNTRTADQTPQPRQGKTPGAIIGAWLQSSGSDTSDEFLDMCTAAYPTKRPSATFFSRLLAVLSAGGEKKLLWKWYLYQWHQGLGQAKPSLFRMRILKSMVRVEANQDLRQGLLLFEQACSISRQHGHGYEVLRPAGKLLVETIMSKSTESIDLGLYKSFQQSTKLWLHPQWAPAVDSMLWLHRPNGASPIPGLRFIEDIAGAATFAKAGLSQRRFAVQLCLGVAHQLLEKERYGDAQTVIAFSKQHFPDLVLFDLPTEQKATIDRQTSKAKKKALREEKENTELLDSLALG